MPDEPIKPAKKPGSWSAVRQHVSTWDKPALLALVKDLYDAAAENRNFIHARCQADDDGGAVLEIYRNKIVAPYAAAWTPGAGRFQNVNNRLPRRQTCPGGVARLTTGTSLHDSIP